MLDTVARVADPEKESLGKREYSLFITDTGYWILDAGWQVACIDSFDIRFPIYDCRYAKCYRSKIGYLQSKIAYHPNGSTKQVELTRLALST